MDTRKIAELIQIRQYCSDKVQYYEDIIKKDYAKEDAG